MKITEQLSREDLTKIASYCDIPGAAALARTNCNCYAIATDDSVWRVFARQINCSITQGKDVRKQVQSFVENLRGKVNSIQDPSRLSKLPFMKKDIRCKTSDIQRMSTQAPIIDWINHLQNYLNARGKLIIWKV
ncbi:MAG: hypothetical protein K1000chlam2_01823 [Chlamydiae bacterium]|nr:hypothetical protein [Chlamydiota bacterium]